MTVSKVTFAPATSETARAYYAGDPPFSFRGYVALRDGEPIGVGGVYFAGKQPWAFSECKTEMTLGDKARAIKILRGVIAAFKSPVFAAATLPTSESLLTKLGFVATGHVTEQGPVMVRLP